MISELDTAPGINLSSLTRRIQSALATATLNGIWVMAETSDLRVSGGHYYMELLEKDQSGRTLAKARAVMWASTYSRLAPAFAAITGQRLASDMKVLVRVDVTFHNVYGLSLVITNINPEYTIGDLARRRAAILEKLRTEGVADLNRSLPWPPLPLRIAVISAAGAAGYGDFVRHLHAEGSAFRFSTTLFEAVMQGEKTAPSIIFALERIMERENEFDCVVIIRGGGAVSDLASFDNYDLAFNVAQFPLPIISGIGHDRDETVIDLISWRRVKTPTAAAALLIQSVADSYMRLIELGRAIQTSASQALDSQRQHLAYIAGQLPLLVHLRIEKEKRRVGPEVEDRLKTDIATLISTHIRRMDNAGQLIAAYSPEATMKRGFSITRINGHAVTAGADIPDGTDSITSFADGCVRHTIINHYVSEL